MAKGPYIPVRFEPEQRADLERAAQENDRSIAYIVRYAVDEWRRRGNGLLKKKPAPSASA